MSGGGGILNQPWGGSGMDLSKAQSILDPAGIFGTGMNKDAAEAFLDPAGIDSGPNGLDLFHKAPGDMGSNLPTALTPNGPTNPFIASGGGGPSAWGFGPTQAAPGMFNQMASALAGPTYQYLGVPPTQTGGNPAMPVSRLPQYPNMGTGLTHTHPGFSSAFGMRRLY